jgi:drug/metabolite transporter (DMT)-like permease
MQIGDMPKVNATEVIRVMKAGVTNAPILLGVFFEALFFACLLALLSKSEVSFLWPLTALSFVFATIAAMVFLGERVSGIRWLGVVLIMLGAAFISYSEHVKPKPPRAPPSTDSGSVVPERVQ